MKISALAVVFGAILLTACASPYKPSEEVAQLDLSFADSRWDGKTVPDGQQCRRFGGRDAQTPTLNVEEIPLTADALVVEYGDRSWGSVGAHGKIGYHIEPGTQSIVIPSVAAHTFDLPEGFFLVDGHLAPHWDTAGAYLPPCSGGSGHRYYAVVKAIIRAKTAGERPMIVAKGTIEMGRF